MKLELITKEFPPYIYGGAGVHVEELSKVLAKKITVSVRAFGEYSESDIAAAHEAGVTLTGYIAEKGISDSSVQTMSQDVRIADDIASVANAEPVPESGSVGAGSAEAVSESGSANVANAESDSVAGLVIHSHTWYANFAGFLASKLTGAPHVITAHSLEPLRPWKKEQLGGGYEVSKYIEKTAYENAATIIAVSSAMRDDILRVYPAVDPEKVKVIHNGIDLTKFKAPQSESEIAESQKICADYGIDISKPTAVFVGRITRQKGLSYFVESINRLDKDIQVVLCAGAPDTKEIEAEIREKVAKVNSTRGNVIWIEEKLPLDKLISVLYNADCFVCPSIYEPLGIVNLEAMALKLPVVATKTGGIPEVVMHGETGYLVDIEQLADGTGTPINPEKYIDDFAAAVTKMFSNLERAKQMGINGYNRAKEHFSWEAIGDKTVDLYKEIL
jgi:starch synthase